MKDTAEQRNRLVRRKLREVNGAGAGDKIKLHLPIQRAEKIVLLTPEGETRSARKENGYNGYGSMLAEYELAVKRFGKDKVALIVEGGGESYLHFGPANYDLPRNLIEPVSGTGGTPVEEMKEDETMNTKKNGKTGTAKNKVSKSKAPRAAGRGVKGDMKRPLGPVSRAVVDAIKANKGSLSLDAARKVAEKRHGKPLGDRAMSFMVAKLEAHGAAVKRGEALVLKK